MVYGAPILILSMWSCDGMHHKHKPFRYDVRIHKEQSAENLQLLRKSATVGILGRKLRIRPGCRKHKTPL